MPKLVKSGSRSSRAATTMKNLEVPVTQLRWRCNPDTLGIRAMDQVQPQKDVIGQDRALRALQVGFEMKHHGYNVFVTGASGTGRTTTIKRLLNEYKHPPVTLTDKCYVYNFRDADSPIMITLPAGK